MLGFEYQGSEREMDRAIVLRALSKVATEIGGQRWDSVSIREDSVGVDHGVVGVDDSGMTHTPIA